MNWYQIYLLGAVLSLAIHLAVSTYFMGWEQTKIESKDCWSIPFSVFTLWPIAILVIALFLRDHMERAIIRRRREYDSEE